VNPSPLYRELRRARSLWLIDVGDWLERGEVRLARAALRRAAAIDGELSFGPHIEPIEVELSDVRLSNDQS
jgi:hypothetical protein